MELYATQTSNSSVSVPAYTNLIKASWILVDIVACHPQLIFLNSSTHYEVKLLSVVGLLQRLNDTIILTFADRH
jgi:hypothetical protein